MPGNRSAVRRVRAVLAAAAQRHRRGARQRRRQGHRAASPRYDEDTTSMGVEAARIALRRRAATATSPRLLASPPPRRPTSTRPTPPRSTPRSACRPRRCAVDIVGVGALGGRRQRSGRRAPARPGRAVRHPHRPAGRRRRARRRRRRRRRSLFGDGATSIAELDRRRRRSPSEFLDRWRLPGEPSSTSWEERFGEHAYVPLAEEAVDRRAEVAPASPLGRPRPRDRHRPPRPRGQGASAKRVGARPEALGDDLARRRSATPAPPTWALLLADVLDRAEPGQTIARRARSPTAATSSSCARPTRSSAHRRPAPTVREQIAASRDDLDVRRRSSPGAASSSASRRAGPSPTARPARRRSAPTAWKFGFVGSRATSAASSTCRRRGCSMGCGAIDQMDAGAHGRRAGHRRHVHRRPAGLLAVSPPVVAAVLDFDGGGRFQCELTDVDPATVDDRRPGRDDVPPAVHRRRRPQLLLEGTADRAANEGGTDMASHGHPRPGRHRRHGLHALRRALGQVAPTTCSSTPSTTALDVGRHRARRRRRLLARHDGLGPVRASRSAGR